MKASSLWKSTAFVLGFLFLEGSEGFVPVQLSQRRPSVVPRPLGLNPDIELGETVKNVLIVLLFGGGLIPATIGANQRMLKTIGGGQQAVESSEELDRDGRNLDPTIGDPSNAKYRAYVTDSGATGPSLPFSSLLLSPDPIPLADVVAVLGRIQNVDSLADWSNLPSTKLMGVSASKPPQWLPRSTFKVNIRKAKFAGWPNDPKTGEPIGGAQLKAQEEGRISKQGAVIGDAALDAVWDTWAWGAGIATPDKVENSLKGYRPNASEADINSFVTAAIAGRSVTGLAALTFIVIQLVAYGSLFVAPALRYFFGIDIGLGSLGDCPSSGCTTLF